MRSDQIDIKLMTWGSIRITLDELFIALRHRLVVITYFICWAAIYPIRFRPELPYLDVWREILIFLLSQVVVILSIPVMVALVVRTKPNQPVPAVLIGPVVFLGTLLGCTAIVGCFWAFTGEFMFDVSTILIYGALHLVLTEIVGALVMTLFLSTILTDIRVHPKAIAEGARFVTLDSAVAKTAVQVSERPPVDAEPVVAPDPVAPALPADTSNPVEVVVAGKRLPKAQLRVIRAAGNYLDVMLRTDKLFVQATMRSVLQQLDIADGVLLHRSLWVAVGEVESFQRQGMDIMIHTREGETVKTARSRQSEVLAWLKQQSIPRRGPGA